MVTAAPLSIARTRLFVCSSLKEPHMAKLSLFISLLAFILPCAALHDSGHLFSKTYGGGDAYSYDTGDYDSAIDVGYDY
jgi:hypothetical protein